jgi:hypothetical protein
VSSTAGAVAANQRVSATAQVFAWWYRWFPMGGRPEETSVWRAREEVGEEDEGKR